MYTIKEAATRTGIPVALLRQWERRYAVVTPDRTPARYRRYDDAAIDRLRLMRQLVDDGWTPSNAASELQALTGADVQARLDPRRAPSVRDDASWSGPAAAEDLVDGFLTAAAALRPGAVESVLDEMFIRGSFEQVATHYLMPALRAVGSAWRDGTIDVAAEHLASAAVLRRLSAAFQASGSGWAADRPVLVGMPPGARHELGALAFAVIARRSGMSVLYLGPDLPVTDWVRAASDTNAWAAVIGVVSPADAKPALEVAAALQRDRPGLLIGFGGSAVVDLPNVDGLRLPADLVEANAVIRAAHAT
jgi:DNA-binding transcriptional MerR regulator/methylmalonyl-CoA mutase cobalamin-binding subunit